MMLHQRRRRHPRWWLLVSLLLFLSTSSSTTGGLVTTAAAAYTAQVQILRTITHLRPKEAYARCLNGWRRDNFGFYFLLPTFVLNPGDEDTGVGMVIIRVPPLFLKEGIIDATFSVEEERYCSMTYQVLNPGWFTFPFAEHIGKMEFSSIDDDHHATSCRFVWTAQWTPLDVFPPQLQPAFDKLLEITASGIIGAFANYVVQVE
jgi:hypothetical protein